MVASLVTTTAGDHPFAGTTSLSNAIACFSANIWLLLLLIWNLCWIFFLQLWKGSGE
jgi:hypothetical protein